ncbi:MAG: diaminopimelate decarboxylase [Clostridia bacterium]|nr:diaminopimelate decarboxylase [Clostridia bacterium]
MEILKAALSHPGLINNDDTAIVLYNLQHLTGKIEELKELFPPATLHAIAVKAMPLPSVLEKINRQGVGLEAASLPELVLALKAGVSPDKVVFDSPVKTREEIRFALQNHVRLNADSLDEVARIAEILPTLETKSIIGLRINPQVGTGTIAITSVAGDYSKFGVALRVHRQEIINLFIKNTWLTALHVHVGSQGCPLPLLIKGVKAVYDLAEEINLELARKGRGQQITSFDMGGGLPVAYHPTDNPPTMQQYADILQQTMPKLFDGTYRLITEFGRWVHLHGGFTVSRVEYVKQSTANGGVNTAMIHLGADMFIRECYLPEQWSHEYSLADAAGNRKSGEATQKYMLAGPLCFQGDIMGRNIALPQIQAGDWLIIHDTGAYTLSQWSRYNSRQMPKVIGYNGNDHEWEVLKPRETPEDLWRFWKGRG